MRVQLCSTAKLDPPAAEHDVRAALQLVQQDGRALFASSTPQRRLPRIVALAPGVNLTRVSQEDFRLLSLRLARVHPTKLPSSLARLRNIALESVAYESLQPPNVHLTSRKVCAASVPATKLCQTICACLHAYLS